MRYLLADWVKKMQSFHYTLLNSIVHEVLYPDPGALGDEDS